MSIEAVANRSVYLTHVQQVMYDCLTRIKTNVSNFIESHWVLISTVSLTIAITMGSVLGMLATGIGALAAWHFCRIRNPIGIVYGITNQYGITSFLIATCHHVDEDSFYHPSIEPMIQQCTKVYTEMGAHSVNLLSHYNWSRSNRTYNRNMISYFYDLAIELAAKKHHIPIQALDEGIASCDKTFQELASCIKKVGEETFIQYMIEDSAKEGMNPLRMKISKAWKQGNLPFLQVCRKKLNSSERLQREAHWLKTLIPHLATTQKPIAIAVGALHVVGQNSLSEKLQEAGFKIQLIAPKI
jgi:hypothetical protein